MFKSRTIFSICISAALIVFLSIKLLGIRSDFIENSSKLTEMSVDGYENYYEKWVEKRLEGARMFIQMAHDPEYALTVIDPLIGLCIFFVVLGCGQAIYYERRYARLLNKSSKKDALTRATS